MSNVLGAVFGLVLIGLSFIVFIYATPSLVTTLGTGVNSTFENQSATFKQSMSAVQLAVPVFAFLMFAGGIALVIKGIT